MKRRWLSVLTVALLIMSLLVGCNTAELGFYNLTKEMSKIDAFEATGELAIDLNKLPESATKGEPEAAAAAKILQQTLKDYALTYVEKVDKANQKYTADFYLKNRNTGEQKQLVSLILKDEALYVRVTELVAFVKGFNDPVLNKKLDLAFKDADYVKLDTKDLGASMYATDMPYYNATPFSKEQYAEGQKLQAIAERFMDGFAKEVLDKYETGLVSGSNNNYTFTIDDKNAVGLIKPTVVYFVNNIDKVGTYLKGYINGLSAEEMKLFGITETQRQQSGQQIDLFVEGIKAEKDTILAEVDQAVKEIEQEAKTIEGTKLVSKVRKVDSKTYSSETKLDLKVTDKTQPAESLDLSITSKGSVKVISGFDVTVPTERVITLKEVENRISTVMQVNVKTNAYALKKDGANTGGQVSVKMIDNYTYLPMRQVSEAFGEQVGWDSKWQEAYVERNGYRWPVTGKLINDRTYVKIREFENLGYKVDWNAATQTVTLSKI